jgi:hypothetical protein
MSWGLDWESFNEEEDAPGLKRGETQIYPRAREKQLIENREGIISG